MKKFWKHTGLALLYLAVDALDPARRGWQG